jgi:hypothetical protein
MKHLVSYLTYFSFLTTCVYAQTSVYHTFPDSVASWKVSWSDEGCFSSSIPASEYIYSISGDTILGLNTYRKITRQISPCGFCCSPPFYSLTDYIGAFREDIAQKKMYFFYNNSTIERLLYDFSLAVGDTLFPDSVVVSPPAVITSIDSILIGTSYRNQFNINGGYQSYIEGIGGTWGFIEELVTFDSGSELLCFTEDNHTLFPDTSSTCSIITSLPFNQKENETFKLYPNPTGRSATLAFSNATGNNLSLTFYDTYGRLIRTITNITTDKIELDLQNLTGGLYLLQLQSSLQTIWTGKLTVE